MLLEHQENFEVVESAAVGIVQHNPYSWIVRDGAFVKLDTLTSGADYLNRTLADWLGLLSNEQRAQFVDTLYSIISGSDFSSFTELRESWPSELSALAENMKNMDDETKRMMRETLRALMLMALKNLPAQMSKRPAPHVLSKTD